MNIKQFIKDRISQNTLYFIQKYVLLYGIREKISVYKRSKLDYFQYEQISKYYPILPSKYQQNKNYGLYCAIKKFDPNYNSENSTIEHGLYFADDALKFDLEDGVKKIYTFGEFRERGIRNSPWPASKSVEVIKVGPYIVWADNFYSPQKRKEIKNELGKVLLVFPSHSIEGVNANFDHNALIDEIKRVSKDYDTTLVCMYYKDIERGLHTQYIERGFRVVSAGTGNDPYFICRQRDLIEFSDMTMSNNIGTHVGYCVALGRPHYIYHQKVEHRTLVDNPWQKENGERDEKQVAKTAARIKKELQGVFNSKEAVITPQQRATVRKYWGEF